MGAYPTLLKIRIRTRAGSDQITWIRIQNSGYTNDLSRSSVQYIYREEEYHSQLYEAIISPSYRKLSSPSDQRSQTFKQELILIYFFLSHIKFKKHLYC